MHLYMTVHVRVCVIIVHVFTVRLQASIVTCAAGYVSGEQAQAGPDVRLQGAVQESHDNGCCKERTL